MAHGEFRSAMHITLPSQDRKAGGVLRDLQQALLDAPGEVLPILSNPELAFQTPSPDQELPFLVHTVLNMSHDGTTLGFDAATQDIIQQRDVVGKAQLQLWNVPITDENMPKLRRAIGLAKLCAWARYFLFRNQPQQP